MSLRILPMTADRPLNMQRIFLSASIPDSERWEGYFDAREITDAVVAAARSILTAGGILVTGAHPTIAPLLLYVAAEFPFNYPRVIVYQSGIFDNLMPSETLRFQESGVGILRIVSPVEGDTPVPNRWDSSLLRMREQMFDQTNPIAGIYVGGMKGIRQEFNLMVRRESVLRTYALGAPGGEAASLVNLVPDSLRDMLATGNVYPTIFRKVVEDLTLAISPNR